MIAARLKPAKSISTISNLAQEKVCERFSADFFQDLTLVYKLVKYGAKTGA
jgi:hypothetical protein